MVREYPAVIHLKERPARSSRYLSEEERAVIADLRRAKGGMCSIARGLGRAVSTVSRELGRNSDPAGGYRPSVVQRKATARLARPRLRKVAVGPVLAGLVQGWLDEKWSPEQISATLATSFPDDPVRRLATDTIYQTLYADCPLLQRDPTFCLRSPDR